MGRLLAALRLQGLRKGVIVGNRRWLTIWAVIMTGRVMHKLLKEKPVVERFTLEPGQTLVVTDLGVAEASS